MHSKCKSICLYMTLILGILIMGAGIAAWYLGPRYFNNTVYEKLVVSNVSSTYDLWIKSTTPVYLSFYFYNITNRYEIYNGSKPNFVELGPYVYRKEKAKEDVEFSDNGTVKYRERTQYFFEPEMSNGNENDTLVAIDLPAGVILSMAHHATAKRKEELKIAFSKLVGVQIFFNIIVKDYIWGYHHPGIVTANRFLNLGKPIVYGILNRDGLTTNDTLSVYQVVYTGEFKNTTMNGMYSYDGQRNLTYWGSEYANMLNGTDGKGWSPNVNQNQDLYLFSPDLCRSIKFSFEKHSQIQGIDTFKYTPNNAMFKHVTENRENADFCRQTCVQNITDIETGDECCIGKGALDLTPCKKGEIVTTGAHFLNSPDFSKEVIGINEAIKEKDETFLEVEPVTGKVVCARKMIQTNLMLRSVDMLDQLENINGKMLSDYLFPMFYMKENGCLSKDSANKMDDKLFKKLRIIKLAPYVLGGVGLLLILTFAGVYLHRRSKLHQKLRNKL